MRGFLAEFQREYELIAGMQIGRLEPGLSPDEVLARCKEKVGGFVAMRVRNKELLNDSLYPMLEDIGGITEEDEADLYETMQKISAYEVRIDPSLAYKVYESLLRWARARGDADKVIKYLYWSGVTLHFIGKGRHDETLAYFDECRSYAAGYHSIRSAETRQYIHRCLGNCIMVLYNVGDQRKAAELERFTYGFWNEILFRGADPEFPWQYYFILCLNYRHGYLTQRVREEPDSETKENIRAILDNAMAIHRLYRKDPSMFKAFGGSRYDFYLWEAQFLSGLISFDQLRENIDRIWMEVEPGDYSANAMFVKGQLSSFLMLYSAKMRKYRSKKDEIMVTALKDTFDFLGGVPMSVSPRDLNSQVQMVAKNISGFFEPMDQLR
ncbi:MAG: hypothetical protein FWE70_06325, partial [Oscillospiraceae bacterium]|nr:hypothetical protein [Oscillospiraceae bacterium]